MMQPNRMVRLSEQCQAEMRFSTGPPKFSVSRRKPSVGFKSLAEPLVDRFRSRYLVPLKELNWSLPSWSESTMGSITSPPRQATMSRTCIWRCCSTSTAPLIKTRSPLPPLPCHPRGAVAPLGQLSRSFLVPLSFRRPLRLILLRPTTF